ncbi:MAG: hypothetical protein RBT74_10340 [Tenuifilaceae bacterium]|jgi:hypothetical protein|nr:hypothetical protein [Tenuifilaceae bacterium]
MASTSETGHARLVANFERLTAIVSSFGADYAPTRNSIKLPALNAKLSSAKDAVATVNSIEATYKHALADRVAAFKGLSQLITRVNNAVKASDTPPQIYQNTLTYIRKLQGRRASRKLSDEEVKTLEAQGETVTQISASQMSFVMRLDNLHKLIQMLSAIPTYAPNEEELKVSSLMDMYNQLRTANTNVINATIPLRTARDTRNILLFHPSTGLVRTSTQVKTYIKSLYGPSSPQYKSISKLLFVSH